MRSIELLVNGVRHTAEVEPRKLLSDFLREDLNLTGTHVGCEHGVCGACTVLVNGRAARACLMFAVQANGAEITTIEGISAAGKVQGIAAAVGELHPIQTAFHEAHGLQCGFCTPGFVVSPYAFLRDNPQPSEAEIRHALSGNLCRCTGYQNIIKAVKNAAAAMATGGAADD